MMKSYTLYFATNRKHEGDRWKPTGYGKEFSDDGRENFRFGNVTLQADETTMNQFLNKSVDGMGEGNGEELAGYLADQVKSADIEAFKEEIDPSMPDKKQDPMRFGSFRFFTELKEEMMESNDVLLFIHGYNVSWANAVGSALTLQLMFNKPGRGAAAHDSR